MKKIVFGLFLLTCTCMLNSCEKKVGGCTDQYAINYNADANENDGSCISIGSPYEGGILAYILQPDDPGYDANVKHGLVVDTTYQFSTIIWGCAGVATGGTSTALGSGQANTTAIVNGCSESGAAYVCDTLVSGVYDDWYLPSRDELEKLYKSKDIIGGFASDRYWSSSESNEHDAWSHDFGNDSIKENHKYHPYYVRAVRSF
ncbi:MAG TPA: DUF1566 domain-containing protein [Bacteroidales bacterium]|nr:DUF1566 domain-containing protein [Bacteroidales bacterium]